MKSISLFQRVFNCGLLAVCVLPLLVVIGCGHKEAKTETLRSEIQAKEADLAIAQKTYDDTKKERRDDWRLSSEAAALDAKIEKLTAEKAALEQKLEPIVKEAEQKAQERQSIAVENITKQNALPPPDANLQAALKANRYGTIITLLRTPWRGTNESGKTLEFKFYNASDIFDRMIAQNFEVLDDGGKIILEGFDVDVPPDSTVFTFGMTDGKGSGAFFATNRMVISFPDSTHMGKVKFALKPD